MIDFREKNHASARAELTLSAYFNCSLDVSVQWLYRSDHLSSQAAFSALRPLIQVIRISLYNGSKTANSPLRLLEPLSSDPEYSSLVFMYVGRKNHGQHIPYTGDRRRFRLEPALTP